MDALLPPVIRDALDPAEVEDHTEFAATEGTAALLLARLRSGKVRAWWRASLLKSFLPAEPAAPALHDDAFGATLSVTLEGTARVFRVTDLSDPVLASLLGPGGVPPEIEDDPLEAQDDASGFEDDPSSVEDDPIGAAGDLTGFEDDPSSVEDDPIGAAGDLSGFEDDPSNVEDDPLNAAGDLSGFEDDPSSVEDDPIGAAGDLSGFEDDPSSVEDDPLNTTHDPDACEDDPTATPDDPCKTEDDPLETRNDLLNMEDDPLEADLTGIERVRVALAAADIPGAQGALTSLCAGTDDARAAALAPLLHALEALIDGDAEAAYLWMRWRRRHELGWTARVDDELYRVIGLALREDDPLLAAAALLESDADESGPEFVDLLDLKLELEREEFGAQILERVCVTLRRLLDANPEDAALSLALARALDQNEDPGAALALVEEVLEREVEGALEGEARAMLIGLYAELDAERTEAERRRLVKRASGLLEVCAQCDVEAIGEAAFTLGDLSVARAATQRLQTFDGDDPWYRRNHIATLAAIEALEGGRLLDVAIWRLYLWSGPDDQASLDEGLLRWLGAQLDEDHAPLALRLLLEASDDAGVDARRAALSAALSFDEEDLEDACLDLALRHTRARLEEASPQVNQLNAMLAAILIAADEYDEAIEAARAALAGGRRDVEHHRVLARALLAKAEDEGASLALDAAAETLESALKLSPDNPALLGLLAAHHPEPERALWASNRLVKLDPTDAEAHWLRCRALIRLERWEALEAQLWRGYDALSDEEEEVSRVERMIALVNRDIPERRAVLLAALDAHDEADEDDSEDAVPEGLRDILGDGPPPANLKEVFARARAHADEKGSAATRPAGWGCSLAIWIAIGMAAYWILF